MAKFDGYLICSDLDGTFRGMHSETLGKNAEAVRYFTENGGRFCFASGRTVEYMQKHGLSPLVNAPCCLSNGGVIYDFQTEAVLREKRVPFTIGAFIEVAQTISGMVDDFYFNIYNNENLRNISFTATGDVTPEIWEGSPIKMILVHKTEQEADVLKTKLKEHPFFANCYISKSWAEGIEITSADGTKGHAIRYIKAFLGDIHTAIGIGDYENDVPLMEAADIGVAVGNALDMVKEKADWIVKPCDEFSICDLVERIEKSV